MAGRLVVQSVPMASGASPIAMTMSVRLSSVLAIMLGLRVLARVPPDTGEWCFMPMALPLVVRSALQARGLRLAMATSVCPSHALSPLC